MDVSPTIAEFRYRAFIAYSHQDEVRAKWLHKALETYRVPARLVGTKTEGGVITRRILTPEKKFIHDIQYSATEITATYDAPPNSAVNYVIIVHDANGNPHNTVAHSATAGGGGPTIKNN